MASGAAKPPPSTCAFIVPDAVLLSPALDSADAALCHTRTYWFLYFVCSFHLRLDYAKLPESVRAKNKTVLQMIDYKGDSPEVNLYIRLPEDLVQQLDVKAAQLGLKRPAL